MLGHVSSPDLEAWATIQRHLKIATNTLGPGTETRTSLSLLYSSKHKKSRQSPADQGSDYSVDSVGQ